MFGPVAGLVAAAALAVSPITVAMARVDMPDALLVLLLVASAWLLVRAIETGRTKLPRSGAAPSSASRS